ncbi:hypothetical protein M0805_002296 [Coniferiporia weirii]|nr:hypothetical protein M0805_002296 [Coniferiporia weirii]
MARVTDPIQTADGPQPAQQYPSSDEPSASTAPAVEPRHSFYETDERLILEIYDKTTNPDNISIKLEPRVFTYENGPEKKLLLSPLKGEIDPDASSFTVGKVKVEVRFVKRVQGRWGALVASSSDASAPIPGPSISSVPQNAPVTKTKQRKNWDALTNELISDKDDKQKDDPNAGGDTAVNGFFQKLFADADEDTRKAMMKSYQESGGTTLSTNWEEVKKGKVDVKPPQGSEWKRWG